VSDFSYTYVFRCSDGKLYVGSTADLKRRIKEHEDGLVPATSYRLPAKFVYYGARG
jgi:putative endonuclease